jgi:sulfopyruvate decarboxylase alpha subunit
MSTRTRGRSNQADWPRQIHTILRSFQVSQVSYVPDAGHRRLIELCHADKSIRTVPLTTEEEGVALSAGAWLGGARSAVLMQSSGVGNCPNMLAFARSCAFPLLMLVTMRGEWGEFNPWQVPMGQATEPSLKLFDMIVLRASRPAEVAETVEAGAKLAYNGLNMVAVLLSQQLIGSKSFGK